MAAISWTDVLAVAPVLATKNISTEMQGLVVDYANETVNVDAFDGEDGSTTQFARVLIAAHFAAMTTLGILPPGVLTSQSEGGVSQGFSPPPPRPELLAMTTYGRIYLTLVENSPVARSGFLT